MVTMSRLHRHFQWAIFTFTHAYTVKYYTLDWPDEPERVQAYTHTLLISCLARGDIAWAGQAYGSEMQVVYLAMGFVLWSYPCIV